MTRRAGQNRRRSERLQHELAVAYRTVGSFLTDWATDISHGGVFINTRKPLPVGTLVKLIIALPGAAFPFDMAGRVTRTVAAGEPGGGGPGMAVEFTELDGAKRERIEAFVEQLRRDLGGG